MGEQREQPKDEQPEPTGELADAELEQASGGLSVEAIKPGPRPLVVTTSNIDAT